MSRFSRFVCPLCTILIVTVTSSVALGKKSAEEAYLEGYSQMGKRSAAWAASQMAVAQAQSNLVQSLAGAQATLIKSRSAAMVTAAQAKATQASTLQTLEKVKSLTMENDLKAVNVFFDKRKMRETYLTSKARKRPSREKLVAYAQALVPSRLTRYEFNPATGAIRWPLVLQSESFLEYRVELDSIFSSGKATAAATQYQTFRQANEVVLKMQKALKGKIRQMSPANYSAASKFLKALAYETRYPNRVPTASATR